MEMVGNEHMLRKQLTITLLGGWIEIYKRT